MHEASLYDANCFVTLTYAPGAVPPNNSLQHRDFQLFMKRLRKHFSGKSRSCNLPPTKDGKINIRFFMCGEYGEENQRPHYHACLFGVDFRSDRVHAGKSGSGSVFYDSPTLSMLWGLGRVSVQDLCNETASYCARYVMKKALGVDAETAYDVVTADGEVVRKRPEYAAMSLKPGIGARWLERFRDDVYPHDYVVQRGAKRRPPKYYDRLHARSGALSVDDVELSRFTRGREHADDNTEERLRVREQVHLARVKTLKRAYNGD